MIVQAVYQTITKKGSKPPSIEKIMPKWDTKEDEPSEPVTPEEQRQAIMRKLGAVAPKKKENPETK